MAMSRKYLADLGLTQEQVEAVTQAHGETVEALKGQRDEAQARAEALEGIRAELQRARADLDAAQAGMGERNVDLEAVQEELRKEREAFEAYRGEIAAKAQRETKEAAFREVLKAAGVSAPAGIEKVLKYTDLEGLELDPEGGLRDRDGLIQAVRTEWPELLVTTTTCGAPVANPPMSLGGSRYRDRGEIMAITDTAARQLAIAENHELFGF